MKDAERALIAVDADVLHGQARIQGTFAVDADRLERLLRCASARGWVRTDRRRRVRLTPVLDFLRAGHPGRWRAWVEFMGGEEVLREHPARHANFDAAMAAGGRMHGRVLARRLDWTAAHRVCDVGGGTGALLSALLAAQPRLEGVLLELPQVAARAPAVERLTVVAGDAFEAVPHSDALVTRRSARPVPGGGWPRPGAH